MSSKNLTLKDFEAQSIGENLHPSPMNSLCFCDSYERLLYHSSFDEIQQRVANNIEPLSFEVAGPRRKIFFDPACCVDEVDCVIVVFFNACCNRKDIGVKNDVFRREANFIDE